MPSDDRLGLPDQRTKLSVISQPGGENLNTLADGLCWKPT